MIHGARSKTCFTAHVHEARPADSSAAAPGSLRMTDNDPDSRGGQWRQGYPPAPGSEPASARQCEELGLTRQQVARRSDKAARYAAYLEEHAANVGGSGLARLSDCLAGPRSAPCSARSPAGKNLLTTLAQASRKTSRAEQRAAKAF